MISAGLRRMKPPSSGSGDGVIIKWMSFIGSAIAVTTAATATTADADATTTCGILSAPSTTTTTKPTTSRTLRTKTSLGRKEERRSDSFSLSSSFSFSSLSLFDGDDRRFLFFSRASCLEGGGTPLTKEERENMEDVEVHIQGEEEQRTNKDKGRHTAQWRVYTDLGREKFLAGDVEFALKCFERALKEAKLGFGEKDAHVAAALNNLAELARTQRMWDKAEGLYKECLDLLKELKEMGTTTTTTNNNNSNSKIDKRKGGEYKAEATIAAALHNLASCMLQNNKPKEAYEHYRTSLNLKQLVFENENHPEIALTLHHMAEALLLLERIEDAIVVLERSVKITDAVGIGHTQTQFRRMRRLCQLYEMKKRFDDVSAMKKRIETQFSRQV